MPAATLGLLRLLALLLLAVLASCGRFSHEPFAAPPPPPCDPAACPNGCCFSSDAGTRCASVRDPCGSGMVCAAVAQCVACGGAGQACCHTDMCKTTPDCADGLLCTGLLCEPCGDDGQPCCGFSFCTRANAHCTRYGGCRVCGEPGSPCCAGNECLGGGCCVEGSCVAPGAACPTLGGSCASGACAGCGALGNPCCAGQICTASNAICEGTTCVACGAGGEPCCRLGSCSSRGCCEKGTCLAREASSPSQPGSFCSDGLLLLNDGGIHHCGTAYRLCGDAIQGRCYAAGCTAERTRLDATKGCVACGGAGEPCCEGDLCVRGSCATGGVCP